jgi:hypothetical protein
MVTAYRRRRNRRSDVVQSEIARIQQRTAQMYVSEGPPPTVFTVSQGADVRGIIADRAAEKTGLRPFLLPELQGRREAEIRLWQSARHPA